jgi:hypothetical protein
MDENEIKTILENNGYEKHIINWLIETNNTIAESITTEIDLNQALFPNYETPQEVRELYEKYKDDLIVKEEKK